MAHTCSDCGSAADLVHFEGQDFDLKHAGHTVTVANLSGWRCDVCDEVEFDGPSALAYAAASDQLVTDERRRQSHEIRRIRRKLGLSQIEAARLTGGGHNAFSRYERGEAAPLPAVVNLFRLLDRHPELLKEIG